MTLPSWLPEMIAVHPWTPETYEALYQVFKDDFILSQPCYKGKPVWTFPECEDGKETIFWHLTSRVDKHSGERLFDSKRAERLSWVRAIIENEGRPEVLDWQNDEGNNGVKVYLWLRGHAFVVILKKYKDGRCRLLTSFSVDHGHNTRKLENKYKRRVK